jgi:hypothetical protein
MALSPRQMTRDGEDPDKPRWLGRMIPAMPMLSLSVQRVPGGEPHSSPSGPLPGEQVDAHELTAR